VRKGARNLFLGRTLTPRGRGRQAQEHLGGPVRDGFDEPLILVIVRTLATARDCRWASALNAGRADIRDPDLDRPPQALAAESLAVGSQLVARRSGRGCHLRVAETSHVTHHGSAVDASNLARGATHQSGLDSAEMRHERAIGWFRARDQSVARRSWWKICGGAGFDENASDRSYRDLSKAWRKLREPPSRSRFVSACRAAHSFVLLQILDASPMHHLCDMGVATQIKSADDDWHVVLNPQRRDCTGWPFRSQRLS
jgi:hypothetical protein